MCIHANNAYSISHTSYVSINLQNPKPNIQPYHTFNQTCFTFCFTFQFERCFSYHIISVDIYDLCFFSLDHQYTCMRLFYACYGFIMSVLNNHCQCYYFLYLFNPLVPDFLQFYLILEFPLGTLGTNGLSTVAY